MLISSAVKKEARKKRHRSIRKRIEGTAERPRLAVFRSSRHIYVQVVDDVQQKTLVGSSDLHLDDKGDADKKELAKKVGAAIAKKCLEKGIDKVVFDRAGYQYHGRISALAEGAREAGLKF
jgi:large subunit ribosomal protein L18